jgi:hypothetical protein
MTWTGAAEPVQLLVSPVTGRMFALLGVRRDGDNTSSRAGIRTRS